MDPFVVAPSQERGLKLRRSPYTPSSYLVAPSQERGLKFRPLSIGTAKDMSLLRRSVD